MVVGVLAVELQGLVPNETVDAEFLRGGAREGEVSDRRLQSAKVESRERTGSQWNLVKQRLPSLLTRQKVFTPKPFIMRSERGMPRSDIAHMSVCIVSGARPKKSQALSCAVWAWGISLWGSGLTAWIRSRNLMASWTKKTGMLSAGIGPSSDQCRG